MSAPAASIADKLDEARALIEKGWTQHSYSDRTWGGRDLYCAVGAIAMVASTPEPVEAALLRVIGGKNCVGTVELWNDKPTRTQAEVVAAFKRAAELAREQVSA